MMMVRKDLIRVEGDKLVGFFFKKFCYGNDGWVGTIMMMIMMGDAFCEFREVFIRE